MSLWQQVYVKREFHKVEYIALPMTELVPENAEYIFKDGRDVGIVRNQLLNLSVLAIVDEAQNLQEFFVGEFRINQVIQSDVALMF